MGDFRTVRLAGRLPAAPRALDEGDIMTVVTHGLKWENSHQ